MHGLLPGWVLLQQIYLKELLSIYNQDSMTTLHYHHITDEEISKIFQESILQVAKIMKAVFNKEFILDSYEELQLYLKEEFLILSKVFASFVNLPIIHINMHLLMHAKTFGTLVNSFQSIIL
ncbi:hypothetical protein GLOIN_2v1841330 [Rhizophagus irregularis DAOM 181602=DAOM 197198]|uniref:Uncharacterized protein n=1 Tax=Rhizophagus irregularis (strain DAOM 181602 / DAOM 197198 / MUCL 43194) TaxID=747089 RepID=A0A2P4Q0C1_RHIID|nr:hypothetical protein GLOIN_2v1841330 [Rhizophagus irregularis DAOM 181602=DAOM 197198]POG71105.1 hypothetical protein GLOIN_2v1841330 [Rhizophagus irregularis DAOM 181602=DAOM 197198]|eukprot:XP_025177971.1 hypothetical protein GLOIN_2v1841330 [Rhizophagus irregularis DAOM 181602=DAOM 197198]